MGLGLSNNEEKATTFLSVAGGYIWDKKKGDDHPQYNTQEYKKLDGDVGVRMGARYDNITGRVVSVKFNTHEQYGESVWVTMESGDERFVISISTNNRYSQDMLKALLKIDIKKILFVNPYDFIDKVKNKRVQGISFKQDGEKIALRNDDAPFKDAEFWKANDKKKVKRFFEDLTEWFVDAVTAKIPSWGFQNLETETKSVAEEVPAPKAEPVAKVEVKVDAEVDDSSLESELEALLG